MRVGLRGYASRSEVAYVEQMRRVSLWWQLQIKCCAVQLAHIVQRGPGDETRFVGDERQREIRMHDGVAKRRSGVGVNAAGYVKREYLCAACACRCYRFNCVAVDPIQRTFQADSEETVDDPFGVNS